MTPRFNFLNCYSVLLHILLLNITFEYSGFASTTEVKNRKSYAAIGASVGDHKYSDQTYKLGIGVSPTFLISSKLFNAQDNNSRSNDFRLNFDNQFNHIFSAHLGFILLYEPNDISAKGLNLGFETNLNELWQSDLMTQLFLDLEFLRYTQSIPNSKTIAKKLTAPAILQRALTVGLSQDISENLNATIAFTTYKYNQNPSNLYDALNNARVSNSSFSGLLYGFPKNAIQFSLIWDFIKDWSSSLSYSTSKLIVDGSNSHTVSIGTTHYFLKNWNANFKLSKTYYSTQENSSTASITIGYYW